MLKCENPKTVRSKHYQLDPIWKIATFGAPLLLAEMKQVNYRIFGNLTSYKENCQYKIATNIFLNKIEDSVNVGWVVAEFDVSPIRMVFPIQPKDPKRLKRWKMLWIVCLERFWKFEKVKAWVKDFYLQK